MWLERQYRTHSAIALCATILFLSHFDFMYDLLLDRCTQHGICLLTIIDRLGRKKKKQINRAANKQINTGGRKNTHKIGNLQVHDSNLTPDLFLNFVQPMFSFLKFACNLKDN